MDGSAFKGLGCLVPVAVVSVPLGIWKLIELVVWFFSRIEWIG